MDYRVVVVGGGVSGLQAGIFTSKAKEDTLVLDTGDSLVQSTSNIQNLICHDSIGGQEILKKGKEKLDDFGGKFREEEVKNVERRGETFVVETQDNEIEAEYIVVASAGNLEFVEDIDGIEFEDGVEGPYMMDRHLVTDEANEAAEGIYAAGLANSWEYQTSTAIGDGAKAAVNLLTNMRDEPFTDHDT